MSLWPQISLGNVGNGFYLGHVDEYLQVEMASGLDRWAGNEISWFDTRLSCTLCNCIL